MRSFLCASALALAAAGVPAMLNAQDTMGTMTTATSSWTATADQMATIGTWPADRQSAYNAWAPTLQEYYWSLTPNQQTGWWALTDEQRGQVYAMTPEQRAQAWTSIEAQLAGAPPRATPATPATPHPGMGMPATPAQPAERVMANPGASAGGDYPGELSAPPPSAMNKKYPVCTRKIQDSCRNPGGI